MDSAPIANVTLDDPFYYLHHFQEVLRWVESRHGDLLNDDELAFVSAFGALPRPARALLVRMVMRKGEHFRVRPHRVLRRLAALLLVYARCRRTRSNWDVIFCCLPWKNRREGLVDACCVLPFKT